jgi:hypothetical protein
MKQQLAELIEAYAAARASGSRLLLEFAVTQLNDFLSKVEISEIQEKTE